MEARGGATRQCLVDERREQKRESGLSWRLSAVMCEVVREMWWGLRNRDGHKEGCEFVRKPSDSGTERGAFPLSWAGVRVA